MTQEMKVAQVTQVVAETMALGGYAANTCKRTITGSASVPHHILIMMISLVEINRYYFLIENITASYSNNTMKIVLKRLDLLVLKISK